ncbi:MAG: MBOAT family protein [Clostridia bacterium]|nr:MBOAT family protein [Clostridia bacterium]
MLHPLYWAALVPAACAGLLALQRWPRGRRAWLLMCSMAFLAAVQPDLWWLTILLTGLSWLAPLGGRRGAAVYAGLAVLTLVVMKLTGRAWPVGLSFVILQGIGYAADAAQNPSLRGSLPEVALYTLFFPKLSAGPVCRFDSFRAEADRACVSWAGLDKGLRRLAFGLGKKLLIADSLYPLATAAFAEAAHPFALAVSLAACPLYVYFDFSGCTDAALGVGQMLGMGLPENFDRPFCALSVREFWRRWHMSLSAFFRQRVYIPLGGSRRGRGRTLRNVAAVFLLMGLWHGFTWNYFFFGLWHAAFVMLEHARVLRPGEWPRPLAKLYALTVAGVGFGVFMASSVPVVIGNVDALQMLLLRFSPMALLSLLLAIVLAAREGKTRLPDWVERLLALMVLLLSWLQILGGDYMPMLYAQF